MGCVVVSHVMCLQRLERKETNQQVEPEPVAADDFKFMKKFEGMCVFSCIRTIGSIQHICR